MPRAAARIAWVESPLQLVNAVEYAAASGEPLHVLIRPGLTGLDEAAAALRPHLPAHVTLARTGVLVGLARYAASRRRLSGDSYSGQLRAITCLTGARDVVTVDDGSMTLSLASQLTAGAPLSRPGRSESTLMRALGTAAGHRLRRAGERGRLSLFTAFATHPSVRALSATGARITENRYGWLRGTSWDSPVAVPRVVLGSALATDGLISHEQYEDWLRAKAGEGIAYLPHRRESAAELARYASYEGLEVVRTGLPAEITLAACTALTEVSMLPSTAAVTLRSILPATTRLTVAAVPDSWWTSRADPELRTMLANLTGEDG